MRWVVLLGTTVAVGAALLPACSADIHSGCSDYFDALLSAESSCGAPNAFFSESERADFVANCEASAAAPGSSNMSGQLETCANDMRSRGCLGFVYPPPSCFFRGTLPDGSACAASSQCSGGVCVPSQTTNPNSELACGACASFLPVGAPCSLGTQGASCDPATGACDGTRCVAYIPTGSACPASDTYCAPGFECTASSVCGPVPTVGQACNVDCNGPASCVNGTCVALGSQGAPCAMDGDCLFDLMCDPQTQQCQPRPPATLGESCGLAGNGAACDTGFVCAPQSETCISPVPLGGACTVGQFQCGPFVACINGQCAIPDATVCK